MKLRLSSRSVYPKKYKVRTSRCFSVVWYRSTLPVYFRLAFLAPEQSHYSDVIMCEIASQIASLAIVYSTIYSGSDQRKHQSSASLAFVWGIHLSPVNSPHKWPVTRKMLTFDDVTMALWLPRAHEATWRTGGIPQLLCATFWRKIQPSITFFTCAIWYQNLRMVVIGLS